MSRLQVLEEERSLWLQSPEEASPIKPRLSRRRKKRKASIVNPFYSLLSLESAFCKVLPLSSFLMFIDFFVVQ